ncbi:MAG TPA: hypothetical protein DIW27_04940 [Cytophagales bacterium]|nr:hypothetical protein [Cytophagales bacterium]
MRFANAIKIAVKRKVTGCPANCMAIAVFLCISLSSKAQTTDEGVLDSLAIKKERQLDSLQLKLNGGLKNAEKLSNLGQVSDTLNPGLSLNNIKLDSIRQKLSFKIDSLNNLGLPTAKYTRLLDSLQHTGPFQVTNKVEQKLSGLQQKITTPGEKGVAAVNDKLALMHSEGGSAANVPGQLSVPGVGAAEVSAVGIPSGANLGLEGQLGSANLNPIEGLGNLQDPLQDIGTLPQQHLETLTSVNELGEVKESLGKVGEVSGQVQGYKDDIKNVKAGNLEELEEAPKALENRIIQMDEVQGIQKEMGGGDQMMEVLESGNDPEAMKKLAAEEVKEKAIDHFAGQSEQLSNAMQRVSGVKQKYSSVKSLKDIEKRPPNPMKGKPLVERIIPGLVLQFQSTNHFQLDYNPSVGYRFGGKVNAGLGWNERVSIGSHLKTFSQERIYGPRVYGEVTIGKGFMIHSSVEKMNTMVPPVGSVGNPNEGSRQWVWSAFVGLKKEYKFMKKVTGSFQFLYNLYDDHDNSPYGDRIVVRSGFEFPQKKKRK